MNDSRDQTSENSDITAKTDHISENVEVIEMISAKAQNQIVKGSQATSTGPRTIQGKKISSRNSLVHGFYARELIQSHLKKSDRKTYLKLFNGFVEELNPVGQSELIQIELMTNYLYLHLRLLRVLSVLRGSDNSSLFSKDVHGWQDDLPSLEKVEQFQQCENHILRNYYRARTEFERLKKTRLGEDILPRLTVDINN
jgi:hypothetical protein